MYYFFTSCRGYLTDRSIRRCCRSNRDNPNSFQKSIYGRSSMYIAAFQGRGEGFTNVKKSEVRDIDYTLYIDGINYMITETL